MGKNRLFWISLFSMIVGTAGILLMSGGHHGFGYSHSMMGAHRMNHGGMFGGGHYPEGISPKNLPDSGSEGAALLISYCTQCHVLPDPESHIPSEWPAVVDRMESNIKALGRRLFTESEKKSILDYLATHSSSKP